MHFLTYILSSMLPQNCLFTTANRHYTLFLLSIPHPCVQDTLAGDLLTLNVGGLKLPTRRGALTYLSNTPVLSYILI